MSVRRRPWTRLAHVLLLLAGLAVVAYAVTLGGSPEVRCRGVAMTPGSACEKADGSAGQTYEQRLATRRSAQPVVGGAGAVVAVFGVVLLVGDVRRGRPGSAVEHAA